MKVEDDDDESISIDVEWKAMTSPVTERSLVESRMAADGWLPALRAAGSALAHFNAGALPSQHIPQLEVSIINEESRDEDNYVVYCISVRAVGRRPSIGGSVDEGPVAPFFSGRKRVGCAEAILRMPPVVQRSQSEAQGVETEATMVEHGRRPRSRCPGSIAGERFAPFK